jgi:hypothetical protein
VLPSHLVCLACSHHWNHDGLEVAEMEPGTVVSSAETITCPACERLLVPDLAPIRLRTAWDTHRGATSRRLERHGGRPTILCPPVDLTG